MHVEVHDVDKYSIFFFFFRASLSCSLDTNSMNDNYLFSSEALSALSSAPRHNATRHRERKKIVNFASGRGFSGPRDLAPMQRGHFSCFLSPRNVHVRAGRKRRYLSAGPQ